ncbi:MAG TPA: response regulator transcription factor, partial [Saprospiraceae bacterium]|nr:response regulator transcription factor [Saprospiraceae bacterium]
MENKHIKVIIIEDEKIASNLLNNYLKEIAHIEVIGIFEGIKIAIPTIISQQPDIVFLDIKLKHENGFHIFDYFKNQNLPFEVIITTAYNEYAIKAIELSAIGYLLKPLDQETLKKTLSKAIKQLNTKKNHQRYQILKSNFQEGNKIIALPKVNGYVFQPLNEILYCKSSNNYTTFQLQSGEKQLIAQNLMHYATILTAFQFFRVNRSYVVNLNHIKELDKGVKWTITMIDGHKIQISRLLRND